MYKISSLDLTFFSVFSPCEAHLIEASCSLSKWASPLEFQGQPLATLVLLSSGSASKFSRFLSVLPPDSLLQLLLYFPPRLSGGLRRSSSKKSAETFFFWRLSRGTLAWQNLFGASKFSIVETFSSCCLNRVLRVLGRLQPFLLQQNKDVVIDIYFFSFCLGSVSRAAGRFFCAAARPLGSLEIHVILFLQWNSLWLYIHATYRLKPSEMMLSHIIYPPKSCQACKVSDYILRKGSKSKISHKDYCHF